MALGVLNNLSAIYAENNLNNTNSSLQTVLEQLSSGSRINSGADDAAGLSLVNGLEANQTALTQSETNATEGVGLLQVADGALSQVTSLLDRAITLATEASNGTLNSTQDSAANQEYQSILSEVNNIGQTTTYNQEQVFDGQEVAIYTGDSSMAGSSVDDLNIRALSESSLGDTGGTMAYSSGQNNVFINLSSGSANAQATDALNESGTTSIVVDYLVKGSGGTENTASTSITVGGATGYTAGTLTGGVAPAGFTITAAADTGGSGGLYLQSGTQDNVVTVNAAGLSDAVAENHATAVAGQGIVVGSASSVTVGPGSGSVNTNDVLAGNIVLSNSVGGNTVTHTFVLGGTSETTGLNGSIYTVDGSTLSDLAAAVTADTALGLTGLASTAGLGLTSNTNSGVAVTATSTLTDTTPGTESAVTLGTFASENDTVAGTVNFYAGTSQVSFAMGAGSTVLTLINDLNNPTNNYGVTASWVAGNNGAGSVLITSNTAGSSGQIASTSGGSAIPVSAISDTAATATLSYTGLKAYNTGLSGTVADSTTGQSAATFATNTSGTNGTATISYSDGAGEALNATDLTNQNDAETALNDLNVAITDVAAQDGYIGAQINTLNSISQVMSTQQENVVSAQNAIQATDYASATSNMSKYEILSQTGIAALAQANSVEQEVTKLLQ